YVLALPLFRAPLVSTAACSEDAVVQSCKRSILKGLRHGPNEPGQANPSRSPRKIRIRDRPKRRAENRCLLDRRTPQQPVDPTSPSTRSARLVAVFGPSIHSMPGEHLSRFEQLSAWPDRFSHELGVDSPAVCDNREIRRGTRHEPSPPDN